MENLLKKKERLLSIIRKTDSAAVAFSAGVDSTLLLACAKEALGAKALAITAKADNFPLQETREAAAFCRANNIRQLVIEFDPFSVPGFDQNPPDRCYLCKKALFSRIVELAKENGVSTVFDGANTDDMNDYRPGMRATRELGVISPLKEAQFSKADVRALSEEMGLPTWNKPAYACLATRFPSGQSITPEKLHMVEKAEDILHRLGFLQCRVRVHNDLARIEIEPARITDCAAPEMRRNLNDKLQAIGFRYVSLDLCGYKMGNMNEQKKAE